MLTLSVSVTSITNQYTSILPLKKEKLLNMFRICGILKLSVCVGAGACTCASVCWKGRLSQAQECWF